jgi:maleate cis-trans isomerase
MIGWRARLGFLVPPGNPTVETEMIELAPQGVSVHFQRMVARGAPGGQTERNQMMLDHIDESIEMLALVQPDVIVLAHTASSYHLGREREADLLGRLSADTGTRVTTAFRLRRGGVAAARRAPNRAGRALCPRNHAAGQGASGGAWLRGRQLR